MQWGNYSAPSVGAAHHSAHFATSHPSISHPSSPASLSITAGIGFLYRTHVPHRGLPPGVGDVMVIAESERQREHLGTLAAQLKTRAEDQAGKSKAENGAWSGVALTMGLFVYP